MSPFTFLMCQYVICFLFLFSSSFSFCAKYCSKIQVKSTYSNPTLQHINMITCHKVVFHMFASLKSPSLSCMPGCAVHLLWFHFGYLWLTWGKFPDHTTGLRCQSWYLSTLTWLVMTKAKTTPTHMMIRWTLWNKTLP